MIINDNTQPNANFRRQLYREMLDMHNDNPERILNLLDKVLIRGIRIGMEKPIWISSDKDIREYAIYKYLNKIMDIYPELKKHMFIRYHIFNFKINRIRILTESLKDVNDIVNKEFKSNHIDLSNIIKGTPHKSDRPYDDIAFAKFRRVGMTDDLTNHFDTKLQSYMDSIANNTSMKFVTGLGKEYKLPDFNITLNNKIMTNINFNDRLRVYENMYNTLLDSEPTGFCDLLKYSVKRVFGTLNSEYTHISDYIELYAYKPALTGSYWFPKEDKNSRLIILRTIINKMRTNTTIFDINKADDRLKVYKEMLRIITPGMGFCTCLTNSLSNLHIACSHTIHDYPELMKYRPSTNTSPSGMYWFPFDNNKRFDILIQIINDMENNEIKRELKITAPEGMQIDMKAYNEGRIAFIPIDNLPNEWEVKGNKTYYYVDSDSIIKTISANSNGSYTSYKNCLPTVELCEANIALCQLLVMRDEYNGDWKVNWEDTYTKYCIRNYKNKIVVADQTNESRILAFKTVELRNKFLTNFKDLIEVAKPLL